MSQRFRIVAASVGLAMVVASARADEPTQGMQKGTPDLQSAGPLTFGPDGILFVGDTRGAAVFAIATGDAKAEGDPRPVSVEKIDRKIADMLGTTTKQIRINDLAVSPTSGRVYLSVTRGEGPEAKPVILSVDEAGKIDELFPRKDLMFSRVLLPAAPDPNTKERGQSLRNEAITDLAFADGRLYLAGLSNEEFSSRFLAIPFPFQDLSEGSSVEIFHGSHNKLETRSPIRTFVATEIGGKPHLLAAYTCTPLVKIPVAELKPGSHVKGTTIAELGNRNRPLDMITYERDGKGFLLLANNSRGVMKIASSGAEDAEPITSRVADKGGLPYETVEALKGVMQLDKLGEAQAVLLVQSADGSLDLKTVDLP
jgi:hypothetical protein